MSRDAKASGGTEIAVDIMKWMKSHTIRDLEDIALGMEEEGENASDVWDFIEQLHGIAHDTETIHLGSGKQAQEEPVHA